MKKNLLLPLSVILACLLMLSSCGQETVIESSTGEDIKIGDTGGLKLPLTKKGEEISILITSSSTSDLNDKLIIQALREVTGINLIIEAYPASTMNEKLSTLVASKKLPDITAIGSVQMANDLSMQGAFASVEDYINEMPNYKKLFVDNDKNNWISKSYAAPDGKLYGVHMTEWQREVNHGVLYRKDVFDQHGIQMWDGPETFYEALKKLKELYPDSTPFTSKNQDSIFNKLSVSWGLNAQQPYYDESERSWKYSDTDPQYKELLDYLKKLYDEKLIDPEFLTLTQQAWTAKMTQADKAFVTWDWIGRLDMFKEQTQETLPNYDLRYGNPIGPKQTVVDLSRIDTWAKYVSNNERAKLAFQFCDFLLSPAGAEMISMGIEGKTYVLDENGKANYIEFPKDKKVDLADLEEKYGMYLQGMYSRFDKRSNYFTFSEREQEAQDFVKDGKNIEPGDPILPFTPEETKEIDAIQSNLKKEAITFATLYLLTDETGEGAWQKWVAKATKLGSEKLVSFYNEAQKRYDFQ